MPTLTVPMLTGRHVVLDPTRSEFVDEIAAAASGERVTFGYTQVPDGVTETAAYVSGLLADAAAGRVAPFVQRRASDGRIVGCTRYMSPFWTLGRTDPDEIEIGGTWLNEAAQHTGINTEAKLLLLSHAFETWSVQRVAICTDARNAQSRRAIERLGASFEGVNRRHRRSTRAGEESSLRDTATYSITIDDWETVRLRLQQLLDR
ncbi:MAG: GNAT family protein [Ilumatobacteraceae bacterium]